MGSIVLGSSQVGSQPPPQTVDVVGHTTSVTASNGQTISFVPSRDGTQIYVYQVTTSTGVQTLRKTISTINGVVRQIHVAIQSDDSIWIAYVQSNRNAVQICKLAFGTWVISNSDSITMSAGVGILAADIDVTDTNMVLFTCVSATSSGVNYRSIFARGASGDWNHVGSQTLAAGTFRQAGFSCSIIGLDATVAGMREVALAFSHTTASADAGVTLQTMRINESNGTQQSAPVDRGVYAVNEVPKTSSATFGRLVRLYRIGTNKYVLGVMHTEGTKKVGAAIFNLASTTHTVVSPYTTSPTLGGGGMAMACNGEFLNMFFQTSQDYKVTPPTILYTYNLKTGQSLAFQGGSSHVYGYPRGTARIYIGSSGKRNLTTSRMPINVGAFDISQSENPFYNTTLFATVPPQFDGMPITFLTPGNNTQVESANPELRAEVTFPAPQAGQTTYRMHFQFATDPAFTSNLIDYLQPSTAFSTIPAAQKKVYVDTLPSNYSLTGQVWYYRARLVDYWGYYSPWSSTATLTIGHSPRPQYVSPRDSQTIPYTGSSTTFAWKFIDPAVGDYQTAYQLTVYRADTNAVIYNTGKIASASKSAAYSIPTNLKDVLLYWKVDLWDSEDSKSLGTEVQYFTMSDPPQVAVNSPLQGGGVLTGVPSFLFTLTTGGGRKIKEYTCSVLQQGVVIWSKRVAGLFDSGTQLSEKIPQGYLNNHQSYTLQVTAIDSLNLNASSPLTQFSVEWVPPASPSGVVVSTAPYNQEDEGYVSVSWDDLARDPNFLSWVVYRKDDLIDPDTNQVLSEGTSRIVYTEYDTGSGYEYRDFFAPSNYKVSYIIKQTISRDGQDMISENINFTSVVPKSDGYWLIEVDSDNADADAFKLSIVKSDSFSNEVEESEYVIIGLGRKIEKGQKLGFKGQLEVSIRNTPSATAREKRIRLLKIQEVRSQLWMRNPFGDSYPVNVGGMSVSRLAGVGVSEFCDVSIPYSEVIS